MKKKSENKKDQRERERERDKERKEKKRADRWKRIQVSPMQYRNGNTWASGRWFALSGISVGDILLASSLRRKVEWTSFSRPLCSVHVPHSSSPPLVACHFTDNLSCENRLHSDSNEASFTPCHASYTPLGTSSGSTRRNRWKKGGKTRVPSLTLPPALYSHPISSRLCLKFLLNAPDSWPP